MEPNHIAAVFGILLMFLISVNNAVLRQGKWHAPARLINKRGGGLFEGGGGLSDFTLNIVPPCLS